MHAMRLLEKWLQRNAIIGYQAREHALVRVVDALLSGGRLALTHLGRHRAGSAFVKHHIKAVDRLLGNRHLHRERDGVYGALARTVLGGIARPVILVDWADSALAHKQLILKAAVPVKGRAISIYEEVHSMRCYNTARTHRRFLHRLQSIVPEGCRPIVVTDVFVCACAIRLSARTRSFRSAMFRAMRRAPVMLPACARASAMAMSA